MKQFYLTQFHNLYALKSMNAECLKQPTRTAVINNAKLAGELFPKINKKLILSYFIYAEFAKIFRSVSFSYMYIFIEI